MRKPPAVSTWRNRLLGRWRAVLALPNNSTLKTMLVALAVCLVCSVVVSAAAVLLKPLQDDNRSLDRKRNILEVAGLYQAGQDVNLLFGQVEPKMVELASGEFVDDGVIDPAAYDPLRAARDPAQSTEVRPDRDFANIGRRERYATVYLVRRDDRLQHLILPVRGLGLYSTLYGFLALEADATTVFGFSVYEHGETPGLGGEVDNPKWRAQWRGKAVYDENGALRIEVIKGAVADDSPSARHQVDGLSGATLTSRGVSNMLRFWLGDDGFGPLLNKLRSTGEKA